MRKSLRVITAAVLVCTVALLAAACASGQSQATVTPVPSDTEAPMIVVTPAPTPVATPTPDASSSAEASDSASSTASSGSSSSSSGVLKRESEGEAVTEAQERLQALGYLDKVTGYFGTDTERAVKEFQEKNDLDVDGKIGPATLEALMSESARQA